MLPIWRRYAKLRTQLYPYIAAASRAYQRTGMPLARHLAARLSRTTRARSRRQDEFMFGPDLLAAPVVEPGRAHAARSTCPRGRWIDLWRSRRLRRAQRRPAAGPARARSTAAAR